MKIITIVIKKKDSGLYGVNNGLLLLLLFYLYITITDDDNNVAEAGAWSRVVPGMNGSG
jgi:hypothetical protein